MLAELINEVVLLLEGVVQAIGYPGIFLIMFSESIFPPIPSEPLYPFFGMLTSQSSQSDLTYIGVWLSIVLGSTTGALIPYFIGVWADVRIVRALVQKHGDRFGVEEAHLDRILALYRRYGALVVLFGRSIPVFKFLVSLTAGASRMRLPVFIFFTALNSANSATMWVTIGYVLGENWPIILDLVDVLEPLIFALAVMAVMISLYLYARRVSSRKNKTQDTPHFNEPMPAGIRTES